MKTVVFGDIHGRTIWKQILERHHDYKRVIFIGDYVDTHENITGVEQLSNLEDIVSFKRESEKEIILLIGNHDFHYWPGINNNCSGFQYGMRDAFQYIFDNNKDLFQMCYQNEEGVVFSHAGFTETFVNQKIGSFSVQSVNNVWRYKPQSFNFYIEDYSNCGDHISQSCIWVRPQSLLRDGISEIQVVGHTTQKKLAMGNTVYFIDTLGTSKEYLVIENGNIFKDNLSV